MLIALNRNSRDEAGKERNAPGSLTFLEAPIEAPDLLSLRALRTLQSADSILYDPRFGQEALDFMRRDADHIAYAGLEEALADARLARNQG